jgi:hypothetical protein
VLATRADRGKTSAIKYIAVLLGASSFWWPIKPPVVYKVSLFGSVVFSSFAAPTCASVAPRHPHRVERQERRSLCLQTHRPRIPASGVMVKCHSTISFAIPAMSPPACRIAAHDGSRWFQLTVRVPKTNPQAAPWRPNVVVGVSLQKTCP